MNNSNLVMVYHEQTKTTWASDSNWEERHETEVISYGTIEIDIDNVFEMKRYMESKGYVMVKNNPFKLLNGIKVEDLPKRQQENDDIILH